MTSPDPRDRATAAAPAAHARHDTFLVAAHAAGDLSGASRTAAESQIATCTACSALYEDLRAIADATQSLAKVTIPASASGRDFRLTPEQAARLNRGRRWRRLLDPLAGSSGAWTRPLAAALTTLGLAGLMLTTVLPGLGGLGASTAAASAAPAAPEQVTAQAAPTAAPAPAAGGVPDTGAGAVGVTSGPSTALDQFGPVTKASPAATGATSGRNSTTEATGPPAGASPTTAPDYAAGAAPGQSAVGPPDANAQDGMKYEPLQEGSSRGSLLPIASIVLIVLGLSLFGLRLVARRLR